ncbi:MAG: hypothetical protein IKR58_04775 [Lachnospiraceae bacterium]|nr:hypothetical protein [Lachnospiraceae bacterium]
MGDVLSFKCPCCVAPLEFNGDQGQMTCEYCGSSFTMEQVKAAQQADALDGENSEMTWQTNEPEMITDENGKVTGYECPSCSGEIIANENTAATECPYCGNQTIIPKSFDGMYKPDGMIPFAIDKSHAEEKLREFYKGKKLLPNSFTDNNHIKAISGVYVPFWLASAKADGTVVFDAVKTKTETKGNETIKISDTYMATRKGTLDFSRVPADASKEMDDALMDSLEPYDTSKMVPYDAAYFSGYMADKYDVTAEEVKERINKRIRSTFESEMRETVKGYNSVTKKNDSIVVKDGKTEYAFLPVWMLSTKYNDEVYTFAMNGQTGKISGSLPIDMGKYWKGVAITTAIVFAIMLALFYFAIGDTGFGGASDFIISLVVGLIIAFIRGAMQKSAMSNVHIHTEAKRYAVENSLKLQVKTDTFMFSKREVQKNNNAS